MTTPLETARLLIRPFTLEDIDDLHSIWNEAGVRRYLWDDEPVPREQVKEIIQKSIESFKDHNHGLSAVLKKSDTSLIGFCGFWLFHHPPQLELLYGISSVWWNQGFATEAARAMMDHGFAALSFPRVIASTNAPNVASVKVMEKLGMTFWKRELTNGLDTIYYYKDR